MLIQEPPVTRALERWPELLLALLIIGALAPIIIYLFKQLLQRNDKDIEYRETIAARTAEERRSVLEKLVDANERSMRTIADAHERSMRTLGETLIQSIARNAEDQRNTLKNLLQRKKRRS